MLLGRCAVPATGCGVRGATAGCAPHWPTLSARAPRGHNAPSIAPALLRQTRSPQHAQPRSQLQRKASRASLKAAAMSRRKLFSRYVLVVDNLSDSTRTKVGRTSAPPPQASRRRCSCSCLSQHGTAAVQSTLILSTPPPGLYTLCRTLATSLRLPARCATSRVTTRRAARLWSIPGEQQRRRRRQRRSCRSHFRLPCKCVRPCVMGVLPAAWCSPVVARA